MEQMEAASKARNKQKKLHQPNKLLLAARMSKGWSQKDVAERIGAPAYVPISRWENGEARPGPHYVQKLCELFQLSPRALGLLPEVTEQSTAFAPLRSLAPDQDVLVAHLTPLIGRERDVETLNAWLLDPAIRLVTLKGFGGVGKTRLVLEVMQMVQSAFPGGTAFLPLASVRTAELVLPTVVKFLGLEDRQGQPLEVIQHALREQQALLICDNCEQIADATPALANLLTTCPRLKLLFTSRKSLPLRAGRTYTLDALALPSLSPDLDPGTLSQNPAVALYLERAREEIKTFQLTRENVAAVTQLCVQLGGIPLAIELAAARVSLFPPRALIREPSWIGVLAQEGRGRDLRQQCLHNTLSWSYQLLSPDEQRFLRSLAPFLHGFTRESAVAINCRENPAAALQHLSALIDWHLVSPQQGAYDEQRFFVMDVIHEYVLEQLRLSGEEQVVYQAHADYFLHLMLETEPELEGPELLLWIHRLKRESSNMRAALQWFHKNGQDEAFLYLCTALSPLWTACQEYAEGFQWLEEARLVCQQSTQELPVRLRAAVLLYAAQFVYYHTRALALSLDYLQESLALYRSIQDAHGIACTCNTLGFVQLVAGNYQAIRQYYEESLPIFEQLHNWWHLGETYALMGSEARALGDIAGARHFLDISLVHARKLCNHQALLAALSFVGQIMYDQGQFADALASERERLAVAIEVGGKGEIAASLQTLGEILAMLQAYHQAATLWGAGSAIRAVLPESDSFTGLTIYAAIRIREQPVYQNHALLLQERVRQHLGEEAFAAAWAAGQHLSAEGALTLVEEGI
ncbi:MAG TPA: helix-turn-helix domain-containing protein [Ktedonobacteraceae bacterium]|jgi:predicted ATPase